MRQVGKTYIGHVGGTLHDDIHISFKHHLTIILTTSEASARIYPLVTNGLDPVDLATAIHWKIDHGFTRLLQYLDGIVLGVVNTILSKTFCFISLSLRKRESNSKEDQGDKTTPHIWSQNMMIKRWHQNLTYFLR